MHINYVQVQIKPDASVVQDTATRRDAKGRTSKYDYTEYRAVGNNERLLQFHISDKYTFKTLILWHFPNHLKLNL